MHREPGGLLVFGANHWIQCPILHDMLKIGIYLSYREPRINGIMPQLLKYQNFVCHAR